jgi:CRP-like cAMP-binding protein
MASAQPMRLTVTGNCTSCAIHSAAAGQAMACPLLPRQAQAGEVIYREGDPAGFVWYVISGAVVLTRSSDRRRHPGRERPAGSFVGLELLVAESYLDTARALVEATLCGAPREAIEGWLGRAGSPARVALEATLRDACNDAAAMRPAAESGDQS